MARYELKIPKLGESVIEATVTAWLKNVGDTIEEDDGILEVATDKVDTEIPCEVSGVLVECLVEVDGVAKVGQTVAIIETSGDDDDDSESNDNNEVTSVEDTQIPEEAQQIESDIHDLSSHKTEDSQDRFYSPLVKNMAKTEGVSQDELDAIQGSGLNDRVTKDDMLAYIENRTQQPQKETQNASQTPKKTQKTAPKKEEYLKTTQAETGDHIIPMGRMERLIADHMIHSVQTSAHVQSFIEIDVTKIVKWRERNKEAFLKQYSEKLTYTPILMQAVAQTIREYPMVNISVDGTNIIKKHDINLGMAAALPDGNLIVPVIKNADELSLSGMTKRVNKLAKDARANKLSPDDIQGGTYTVTNVGSFGSITGTPIINQPQVAILALGAIRKMPAVIETPEGDVIAVRHQMIVAHSYDHRVINGALGGQFILRFKELLENFNESDL